LLSVNEVVTGFQVGLADGLKLIIFSLGVVVVVVEVEDLEVITSFEGHMMDGFVGLNQKYSFKNNLNIYFYRLSSLFFMIKTA